MNVSRVNSVPLIPFVLSLDDSNLSEETKEKDLSKLFTHFGTIHQVYLAKDKTMQCSKVNKLQKRVNIV